MSGKPVKTPLQPVFVRNLLLMLFLGVGISAWILRYTDVFEEFAGLLALSGLFSWLAFVSKVLPEDRVKALQEWADRAIFTDTRTSRILAVLSVLAVVLSGFLGSLQVQSFDPADRAMQVDRPGKNEISDTSRLLSGGKLRQVFWTSWPWRSSIRVKAIGLPELLTTVGPWERKELYLPTSFLRPVLLLTPSPKLIDLQGAASFVEVYDDKGNLWDRIPFDGRAIWLGCDRDVQIPSHAADALREEIKGITAETDRLKAIQSWFNPTASEHPKALSPGEVRLAFLFLGTPLTELKVTVLPPTTFRDFPQRIKLEVP